MALHLLIMCVGIESIGHLRRVEKRELEQLRRAGEPPTLRHWTRNKPRRADEILDGGSIYWIIKGHIRVRQAVVGIEQRIDPERSKRCLILFDPKLVRTVPVPRDPMQGWRYLEDKHAPADLDSGPDDNAGMPPEMAAELRSLGLL